MLTINVIAGLQLCQNYMDSQIDSLMVDQDEIRHMGTDRRMSDEDVAKMRELGWDQLTSSYSRKESWIAYF